MVKVVISTLVGLVVFATGAAGLVYQVAFERYLSRIVGSDHVATGLTLATFLGGLAVGYWLCGRLTLAVEDHLRGYSVLEAGIGLWALAFPWLFAGVASAVSSWSFTHPWGLLFQGLAVAFVLILPPTLVMGATVPFLTRALSRLREEVSSTHAAVYAVNTAGAFAGALLAGFYLIPTHGLPRTVMGAAAVNLGAALFFGSLSLVRRRRGEAIGVAGVTARPQLETRRFSTPVLYAIAFLNGYAVLSFEASMIRFGKLTLGSSSYTFAMIVAVFVLAIALGSMIVSRSRSLPAWLLFGLQAPAGVYLLVLYATLDEWPYYGHLLRIGFQAGPVGFHLFYVSLFLVLFALLVLPVALLGATLPIVFHELDARIAESGWISGRLLAWNGLGALLGSIGGAFALYYFFDAPTVFLMAPLVVFVTASFAARPLSATARASTVVLFVAAVAMIVFQPLHDHSRFALGTFRFRAPSPFSLEGSQVFFQELYAQRRVLAFDDDPVATVAVLEEDPDPGQVRAPRVLTINGKSESSTVEDAETIRLLAHLPALWAQRREHILVIGLGTGVTAGELALYPDVKQIDVAEISPAAVRFLPLFGEFTHDVHNDPRLRIHLRDALLALRQGRGRWDLIVSEPSNPWVTGVDHLFTRECYGLVRSRLAEDGLFVQWMQIYEADFEMLATVLNTLRLEFPTIHAFRTGKADLLLMATGRPLTGEDRQRAEQLFVGLPRVQASLEEIGISSIGDLLAKEVRSLPVLFKQSGKFGVNTMDEPRLHYLAGRAMFSGTRVTDSMLRGVTDLDFLFDEEFRAPRR